MVGGVPAPSFIFSFIGEAVLSSPPEDVSEADGERGPNRIFSLGITVSSSVPKE